ncbi:hypothetical protein NESM_000319400 [Novymonas esmeraldas]|uniref:Uncharacterized protein n=1 Tax=Novymonas esmeraldas TaxID=1808958 RepID=A0AAW0ELC9_9TRYP
MHALTLPGLCAELSRIQVDLLQRRGAPLQLAHEGIQLLREQLPTIELPSSVHEHISGYVPKLLRSCATVLRHAPDEDVLPALEALDFCTDLAARYEDGGHLSSCNNLTDLCSMLRSINALDDCQTRMLELSAPSSHALTTSPGVPQTRRIAYHLAPVYQHAMRVWSQPRERVSSLNVLSLLEATSRIHGRGSHAPATGADKCSLLPAKAKIHMEAKMQRCIGARGLLASLREAELNRTDAGMSLATMAQTGLYDAEVCNRSCDVLFWQHALLTSQQLCQVLFHLGTLQHRHVHQKFFSSLIEARNCNAEAVRQHVLGLAMLRQPPPSETRLMDGIFLHALRSAHAPPDASERSGDTTHGARPSEARWRRALRDPLNDDAYTLPPQWYIDVGHGLTCLDIQHPKYKLMTARQTRRSIGRLTTVERCKLLYALGGLSADQVPPGLQTPWRSKVERSISIVAEKLKDIEPHEGPYVMNALLHCGIHEHCRIPRAPRLESEENPVEVLLRTWATVPKERVLELTEQIRPQHLRAASSKAPSTVAKVVVRVAATFGEVSRNESYRLEPLCAAVEAHCADMTAADSMRTLQALLRIGRTGPRRQKAIGQLLANLWARRYDLDSDQLHQCCACVQHCTDLPDALRLLQFAATH